MTVTLAPLGIIPVLYGYLLEGVTTRSLLYFSIIGMAITELWMWHSTDYVQWMLARSMQGVLLPALMTAVMTYSATCVPKSERAHAMGLYVGATIVGGFFGRMLAGGLSTQTDPTLPFLVIAILLLTTLPGVYLLPSNATVGFTRIRADIALRIMRLPRFWSAYLIIFLVFFVFTAVLTLLPFELRSRDPGITDPQLGLLYVGYLSGLMVSLRTRWLRAHFKSETRLVVIGLALFMVGTLSLLYVGYLSALVSLFLFCGGMFLVHVILSGFLNHTLDHHHGVINGLYLAFYYTGGALGSYLPGMFYEKWGWSAVIGLCAVLLGISFLLLRELTIEPD